jgi:hypothetical protein
MEKRSVQVNCRMSADSAGRLKELADSAGLPLGAFIEKLLDCYHGDSKVIARTENWQSAIDDLRESLTSRLLALEMRLGALEAVGAVTTGAVEEEGLSAACEPVGVALPLDPPVDMEADPVVDHDAANQNDVTVESSPAVESDVVINQDKAAFDTAVIAAYKSGITKGADILRHVTAQGYRNSEGNAYYRSGVEHTLKRAGLKD